MEQKQIWPIELELASYHYDEEDETPAVDKVSLQVEKGSFVAVLGHNGSGKSTMAKLMNIPILGIVENMAMLQEQGHMPSQA